MPFRIVNVVLLYVALSYPCFASGQPKDQGPLEGSWKVIAAEANGKKFEGGEFEDLLKKSKMTFKGDAYESVMGAEKLAGKFKIDSARDPKHITYLLERSGKKAELKGIFELKERQLHLIWAGPGGERPTMFKTKENDGCFLMVLERLEK